MNIIEFIEDPHLINDKRLSAAQKVSLKAVYGLHLNQAELKIFRKITGHKQYRAGREYPEASFVLGRRSGKSDQLASNIALYEACSRKHKLSVGQIGVVMIVASELKRQSKIVFNYCLEKLEQSPVLKRLIKKVTAEEILLTNNISIQVYPCNLARIRGQSLVTFIGDETAFWKSEGKNVDEDVVNAARPGLEFPYSKLLKISSPYMMRGEIYNDYKRYFGKQSKDIIVFKGDTLLFNPSYSKKKIEALKRRDPTAYRTEILAEFRADLSAMYDPLIIDDAVDPDRPLELPYRNKYTYQAFVDVAGGGGKDSYALAIGHEENGLIVVDVIRSRQPKFNPEEVTAQYCELLKKYKISSVTGDKYSGDWASNAFNKYGITYERSEKSKSELYLEAESLFNTQRINIPKKESVLSQFKMLVRRTRSGGKDSVDTDSGQPEDEANVIAGICEIFAEYDRRPQPWIWCPKGPIDRIIEDLKKQEKQARSEFIKKQKEKEALLQKTIKVKMLKDLKASLDGISVKEYKKEEIYNVPEILVNSWLKKGIAEKIKAVNH